MGTQKVIGRAVDGAVLLPDNGRLRVEFDTEIDYLNVDNNLLLHLTKSLKKKGVGRMKFSWNIQERKKDFVSTASAAMAAATSGSFVVAAADLFLFAEGDIINFPAINDNANLYVTGINTGTNTVSVEVVDNATTLSLVAGGGDECVLLGNSFESGSNRGTIKNQQPTTDFNYLQILQTPMGITTTGKNLTYESKNEWDKQKFECAIDHAFAIEKTLFMGQRHTDISGRMGGEYEQWFTGGLQDFISTNATDAAGALTQAEFASWLISSTKYAQRPVQFASELIFEGLTTWAETKLELQRNEKTLGMAVTKYLTPYGKEVMLMPHREFLVNSLNDRSYCTDLADIEYRYLNGLDTHIEVDIQTPGDKKHIDEMRTWFGLKVGNEKRHGLLYGVTSITP